MIKFSLCAHFVVLIFALHSSASQLMSNRIDVLDQNDTYQKLDDQFLDESPVRDVVCPGGEYLCPDDNTCCRVLSGDWGCCPLPDAVCCDDEIHCCPSGTTCAERTCQSSTTSTPWAKKALAKPLTAKNVVCPGGSYQCPDRTTCCQLPNKEWGCCPYPDADCCEDGIHCCPSGSTCGKGRCQSSTSMAKKISGTAIPRRTVNDVVCQGGGYHCPDDFTCCMMASGEWGCCPLPDAVCCDDGLHCCPSGMSCTDSGGCDTPRKLHSSIPWSTKIKATPVPNF